MGKKKKRKSPPISPKKKKKKNLSNWLEGRKKIVLLVILLSYGLTGILHFSTELSTIGDNAQFVVLGQSLAEGEGYKVISSPNPPYHTKYPFGFPALLALFYYIFHLNYLGYKIIVFLLSIGALYYLYRWFEHYSLPLLFSFLSLMALNLKTLEYSSLILSEFPFLFFVTIGFYFFYQFDKFAKYRQFALGILSFGIAYYMRSIAIVLFPALFLYLVFKKEYKLAVISILATLVILTPWQIWTKMHGGASYLKSVQMKNPYSPHLGTVGLSDILTQRIPANFKGYFLTFIPETIFPVFKAQKFILKNVLGGLLTLVVLAGFIVDFWKRWDIKGWYFLGTLGVLLLWPEVWMGERFLFGVIPLIVFYFIYFIHWMVRKYATPENKGDAVFAGITIAFLCILLVMQFNFKNPQTQYTPDWVNYKNSALWIKQNTAPDVITVCRKPYLAYLWSGKKTVSVPTTSKEEEIYKRFTNTGATHILFDGFYWTGTTRRYLGPFLQKNQSDFVVVYALKNPPTYVLEFKPTAKNRE